MVFHGYYVIVATFFMNFVSLGTFYSAAVFLVPLEATFAGAGRGVITFLPTIYLSVALFSSLGAGWIQGILQRRGLSVTPVFTIGGLCIGVGSVGSSYGTSLDVVLLYAIITGIGIGWTGFPAAGVCVMWFDKNRGTMLLLAMAGSGVGDFLYSLVIQKLLNWYTAEEKGCSGREDTPCDAWRSVMRLAGLFSMTLAVASSFMLRLPERGEVEKYEKDDEKDEELDSFIEKRYGSMGHTLIPGRKEEEEDGDVVVVKDEEAEEVVMHKDRIAHFGRRSAMETLGESFRLRYDQTHDFQLSGRSSPSIRLSGAISESNAAGCHQSPSKHRSSLAEFEALGMLPVRLSTLHASTTDAPTPGLPYLSLAEVLDTNTTSALLLWTVACAFVYTNFYVHLPAYAESVGLSADTGARALSLTGVGMLAGNISLGRVTDAAGPIAILRFTMCALTVLLFLWPYCTTSASLSCVAFFFGYMASTQSSVPLIIMADAFGETSPDSILTLLGLLNACKFPGYLFGPSCIGYVYEMLGDYHIASIITGTGMLLGNIFLAMLPSTEEQNKMVIEKHGNKL